MKFSTFEIQLVKSDSITDTSNVWLSISISGNVELFAISFLEMLRQLRTGKVVFFKPYSCFTLRAAAALETNNTEVDEDATPTAAYWFLIITGSQVGIEAFDSPQTARAITPALNTANGFAPKNFGSHATISAILPISIDPT